MGQERGLPCKWNTWMVRQECRNPEGTPVRGPQPASVPVQLCEKCRAWKSPGQIAECLECKHFPEKKESRELTQVVWDKLRAQLLRKQLGSG